MALIFLLQWSMAERYFVLQIKAFLGQRNFWHYVEPNDVVYKSVRGRGV
jgi:hypothetical protein